MPDQTELGGTDLTYSNSRKCHLAYYAIAWRTILVVLRLKIDMNLTVSDNLSIDVVIVAVVAFVSLNVGLV